MRPAPNAAARLRLFCFPYAGGGASVFREWAGALPADVELVAVQLPGREGRLGEPPFKALPPLVAALAEALAPALDRPYACFGHSMGAWLSYELTRLRRRQQQTLPLRLFVSACRAPDLPDRSPPIYHLPDAAFLAELRRLGGIPDAVFAQRELMQLLMPLLRADMEVCDRYEHRPESPLAVPISVFGGADDEDVSTEELRHWQAHTTAPCTVRLFPGNHFYLQSARPALLAAITAELEAMGR